MCRIGGNVVNDRLSPKVNRIFLDTYDGAGNDTPKGGDVKRKIGIYSYSLGLGRASGFVEKLKFCIIIILSAILISTTTSASPRYTPPDFIAQVTEVDNWGIVIFDGHGGYRLWGLQPEVDFLRDLLVGKELACYEAGEIQAKWGSMYVKSRSAVCFSVHGIGDSLSRDIGKFLLETDHAIELCAETLGVLGTCPARGFD